MTLGGRSGARWLPRGYEADCLDSAAAFATLGLGLGLASTRGLSMAEPAHAAFG